MVFSSSESPATTAQVLNLPKTLLFKLTTVRVTGTLCFATEGWVSSQIQHRAWLLPFCFEGDCKRDFNPTCYRSEDQYTQLVTSVQVEAPDGGQTFGFDIVFKRKVQTYVEVKFLNAMEFRYFIVFINKFTTVNYSPVSDEKQSESDLLAAAEGAPLLQLSKWVQHLPAVPGQPAVHPPRHPALREDVRRWLRQHGGTQYHQGRSMSSQEDWR